MREQREMARRLSEPRRASGPYQEREREEHAGGVSGRREESDNSSRALERAAVLAKSVRTLELRLQGQRNTIQAMETENSKLRLEVEELRAARERTEALLREERLARQRRAKQARDPFGELLGAREGGRREEAARKTEEEWAKRYEALQEKHRTASAFVQKLLARRESDHTEVKRLRREVAELTSSQREMKEREEGLREQARQWKRSAEKRGEEVSLLKFSATQLRGRVSELEAAVEDLRWEEKVRTLGKAQRKKGKRGKKEGKSRKPPRYPSFPSAAVSDGRRTGREEEEK